MSDIYVKVGTMPAKMYQIDCRGRRTGWMPQNGDTIRVRDDEPGAPWRRVLVDDIRIVGGSQLYFAARM